MEQVEEDAVLASVAPIVAIAHALLEQAIDANATEIHIEPGADRMEVSYRIGGVLHRHMVLPTHIYPNLVTRYKVMAEVSWASRQQPVQGHFTLRRRGRYYDCELTFPLRLLDPKITVRITPGADAEGDDEDVPL